MSTAKIVQLYFNKIVYRKIRTIGTWNIYRTVGKVSELYSVMELIYRENCTILFYQAVVKKRIKSFCSYLLISSTEACAQIDDKTGQEFMTEILVRSCLRTSVRSAPGFITLND